LRSIDGIERMRLIRKEIAHKVRTAIDDLVPTPAAPSPFRDQLQ